MPRTPLRPADLYALGLWVAAGALVGVTALIGPEVQCDYDTHDAYVSGAHRAATVLLGSAVAMATAGTLLTLAALRRGGRRAKIVRGGLGLVSIAAACFTGLIGLLELVAFGCLE